MGAAYLWAPLGSSTWRAARELARGVVVAKRYQARKLLGSGASGEVWQAEDLATGAIVALKKLRTGCTGPELLSRFRREAQLYARMDSDRVARLLDLVFDDTFGSVQVLEHVDGEPLSELLKRRCLSVEEAIELGLDLLVGVAELHRQMVVHRDLKPANVLMRNCADGKVRAVIVDLGAGRALADGDGDDDLTGITRGPMVIGTLAYLAPEQLIDSRAVSAAADLYAVGVILYRAVSGSTPFAGLCQLALASSKRREEAPMLITGRADARARAFEDLLITALKRLSAERFLSADDMRRALEAARDAQGPTIDDDPGAAPIVANAPTTPDQESCSTTLPRPEAVRSLGACGSPHERASTDPAVLALAPDALARGVPRSPAPARITPARRRVGALIAAAAMLCALTIGAVAGWRTAGVRQPPSRAVLRAAVARPTLGASAVEPEPTPVPSAVPQPEATTAASDPALAPAPAPARRPASPSSAATRGTRPAAPAAGGATAAEPGANEAAPPRPLDPIDPWATRDGDARGATGDAGSMSRAAQLEPVR